MINSIGAVLIRWRWLATALKVLVVNIIEAVKHQSDRLSMIQSDVVREIFAFGVVYPLVVGIILSRLAYASTSKSTQTTPAPKDRADEKIKQRVLIVENNLVLGAVIGSLLTNEANLELIGSSASSEAELIGEIRQSQAEVVILSTATAFTDPVKLLASIEHYPQLRVVVVSADKNVVQLYEKRQILVDKASDLANLIQGAGSPGQSQKPEPKSNG